MSITITKEDILYKSITYSSVRFLLVESTLICYSRRSCDHRDNKPSLTTYTLPIGISKVIYIYEEQSYYLQINIIEKGKPVGLDNDSQIHMNMTVSYISICEKQIKTDINYNIPKLDILKDFIETCKEIYQKEVQDKTYNKKKLLFYIWDDYWEVYSKKIKRPIQSLCFDNDIHFKLLDTCKDFLKKSTEDEYLEYGIPYKFNILLEGIPGTGKTSIIHCLASELDMNIATITFDPEMTDIKFMKALKRIPEDTIITLEDVDVLFKKRKENEVSSPLTFSGLLNSLDGMVSLHKQIIILTTNYCCNLDSALKRPGRIDRTIHFDYSSKKQIQLIFMKFFKNDGAEDYFNTFYEEIKHLKLTTAILQGFLFRYRNDDIIENVEELKKIVAQNKYDESSNNLYM